MLFVGESGREVQRIRIARAATAAEHHVPERGIGDDRASGVLHLIEEGARRRIIGIDGAVAKVSNQQFAAKGAETGRRNHGSPWSIEIALRNEALYEIAVQIEQIHVACAGLMYRLVLRLILHRVGPEHLVIDEMNAERREARGKIRVDECSGESLGIEEVVVNLDSAGIEIGREK